METVTLNASKTCPKCNVNKLLEEFHKAAASKDGHQSWCKECNRQNGKEWEKGHSTQRRIAHNRWKREHTEAMRAANRRWQKAHPEQCAEQSKRHRERQPTKSRARDKLKYAVKSGRMSRPTICTRCSKIGAIQAHHEDYDKPFEVEWMCKPCHILHHKGRA